MLAIDDRVGLTSAQRRRLVDGPAQYHGLDRLVGWALATGRSIADIVVQDEYTHDVVIPWDDDLYLVFDST